MNVVFVVLVVLVMSLTQFEAIISHLLGLWSGILIILKMIFQLRFAQRIVWTTNCTQEYVNQSTLSIVTKITTNSVIVFNQYENGTQILEEYPFNSTVDNREYIGFKKTDNIFGYIIVSRPGVRSPLLSQLSSTGVHCFDTDSGFSYCCHYLSKHLSLEAQRKAAAGGRRLRSGRPQRCRPRLQGIGHVFDQLLLL